MNESIKRSLSTEQQTTSQNLQGTNNTPFSLNMITSSSVTTQGCIATQLLQSLATTCHDKGCWHFQITPDQNHQHTSRFTSTTKHQRQRHCIKTTTNSKNHEQAYLAHSLPCPIATATSSRFTGNVKQMPQATQPVAKDVPRATCCKCAAHLWLKRRPLANPTSGLTSPTTKTAKQRRRLQCVCSTLRHIIWMSSNHKHASPCFQGADAESLTRTINNHPASIFGAATRYRFWRLPSVPR